MTPGVSSTVLSIVIGAALVLSIAALLAGCAVPRDDGMGDYWRGVACVQKGNCP